MEVLVDYGWVSKDYPNAIPGELSDMTQYPKNANAMERLNEVLKSHGIKPNTNRSLVIKYFIDDHKAHSLCTLHEILKGQMDRTTVYRILVLFTDNGILKKIPCSDGNLLFALKNVTQSKLHSPSFRCKTCQKVEELPELPDGYLNQLEGRNYSLESIALEGYCRDCQ